MMLTNMKGISQSVYEAGRAYYAERMKNLRRNSPIGIYTQLFYASYLTSSNVCELVKTPYPFLRVIKNGEERRVYVDVRKRGGLTRSVLPILNRWDALMWSKLINFRLNEEVTLDFTLLAKNSSLHKDSLLYVNLRQFLKKLYAINPPVSSAELGFGVLKRLRAYDLVCNNNLEDSRIFYGSEKYPQFKGDIGQAIAQKLASFTPAGRLFKGLPNSMRYIQLINES